MPKKLPFFPGFKAYLETIRNEYATLGKKIDSDELDLPQGNPVTYSQQMAIITRKLDVVINNVDLLQLRSNKAELEQEIADTDEYYKGIIAEKKEELTAAKQLEEEMRNRYISAYEKNAPYLNELKLKGLDTPEEINRYIPVDQFKAAWEEASRKLSKLQNEITTYESSYQNKSERLMADYKQNEENLIANSDSIERAEAAWNDLNDIVHIYQDNNEIVNFTEDQLKEEPAEGEMSNYDKWNIQNDLLSLGNMLTSCEENAVYNQQFKNINSINKKFDDFEITVADHFDSDYANVSLEDQGDVKGIYSELQSEEMVNAAKDKQELRNLALNSSNADPQKMRYQDNDDYGILVRTLKEKETPKYKSLIEEQNKILSDIENHNKELNQMKSKRDAQDKIVNEWKDPEKIPYKYNEPEFTQIDSEISVAQENLNKHNAKIANKENQIEAQKKLIEVDLPNKANIQLGILNTSETHLESLKKDLDNFNSQLKAFDEENAKEIPEDVINEFDNINLDKWTEEYIKLSPVDGSNEIQAIFAQGLETSKQIGIEIADQEYALRKDSDLFTALKAFRAAAEQDKISTSKQISKEDGQRKKALEDKYNLEREQLVAQQNAAIESLQKELDSNQNIVLDDSLFNDVKDPKLDPGYFVDRDDYETNDEYQNAYENDDEYLESKEALEEYLPEWKNLVIKQQKDLLERENYIQQQKTAIEDEYNQAVKTANDNFDSKYKSIDDVFNRRIEIINNSLSEQDKSKFNTLQYERYALESRLNNEKEEFTNQQKDEAYDFEKKLEQDIAEMEKNQANEFKERQKEYEDLSLKNVELGFINRLENSGFVQMYSKLGRLESQLKYYNSQLPKNPNEASNGIYAEIQSKANEIQKQIDDVKADIASHDDDRLANISQAQRETIANEQIIKGQLEYLKELQAQEKKDFINKARAEFEQKQASELNEFNLNQQSQLQSFDNAKHTDVTLNAQDEIKKLEAEREQKISELTDELEAAKDVAWRVHRDAEKELDTQSIENLQKDQEREREEFINNTVKDGDKSSISHSLNEYQKNCASKTNDLVGERKKIIENRRTESQLFIDQLKHENQLELDRFDLKHSEEMIRFDLDNANEKRDINDLIDATNQSLNAELKRLNQLNAERTSIPNKIVFTEIELKEAEQELDTLRDKFDESMYEGYSDLEKNTDLINDYEDKFSNLPKNIVSNIENFRFTRSISTILKNEINDWAKKNINSDDPKVINQKLAEASDLGRSIYEQIDSLSDMELANSKEVFENSGERQEAKNAAFMKAEREILSMAAPGFKEAYSLYTSVKDLRDMYLDIAKLDDAQRKEFNADVNTLTKAQMDSLNKQNVEIGEHLDPTRLANRIFAESAAYSDFAETYIRQHVIEEYVQKERELIAKESEPQRAKYDLTKSKLKSDISNGRSMLDFYKKELEEAKTNLDPNKKELAEIGKSITSCKDLIKKNTNSLKDIDKRLKTLNKELTKKGLKPADVEAKNRQIDQLNNQKNEILALKEQNNNSLSDYVASQTELTKKINDANKAIKNNPSYIKDTEAKLKKDEASLASLGEFVYKPKKVKTSEQRDNEINEQIDDLTLKLREDKVFSAIHQVYENRYKKNKLSHEGNSEILAAERKLARVKNELDTLRESQRTNEANILNCNKNIAKFTADKAKYAVYARGLGKEYGNTEKQYNNDKDGLAKLIEKQEQNNKEQLDLQVKLREKLNVHNEDPFAQQDNLFKKRRLLAAAVKRSTSELKKNEDYLATLESQEKSLVENYLKNDQYGTILNGLSDISTSLEHQQKASELSDNKKENKTVSEINDNAIKSLEDEINAVSNKKYSDKKSRLAAKNSIDEMNEKLKKLYEKKHALEEERNTFPLTEQALEIIALRQSIQNQRLVINERKSLLRHAQNGAKAVEDDIKALHEDLLQRQKAKAEVVQSDINKVANQKQGVDDLRITQINNAKQKLSDLESELNELKTGKEKIQIDEKLKSVQDRKEFYLSENKKTDKLNADNLKENGINGVKHNLAKNVLKDQNEQIHKQEQLINTDNQNLNNNKEAIVEEKKSMHLTMLKERKELGDKMLNIDKLNKLNNQREKIENFQQKHLNPMLDLYNADKEVKVSNDAIARVNQNLQNKMANLVAKSKTVKKKFFDNTKEFTEMITAIQNCVDMDSNTSPEVVSGMLNTAVIKAKNYIKEREEDFFKTSSLLRKNRLDIARNIIRTSELLKPQYDKLVEDKAANQGNLDKYQQNKQNVQALKDSVKENNGVQTYGKFCEMYPQQISNSNADKFKDYRTHDEAFKDYTKNIYTKEWDKVEKKISEKYDKFKEENKQNDRENPWALNSEDPMNLKNMYQETFKESQSQTISKQVVGAEREQLMVMEIVDKNLDHIEQKQLDEFYTYEYKKDPTDFSQINIGEEKKKFDQAVKNKESFKLVVEKKSPEEMKLNNKLKDDPIYNNILKSMNQTENNLNNVEGDAQKLGQAVEHPKKKATIDNELLGGQKKDVQNKDVNKNKQKVEEKGDIIINKSM